MPLSVLLLPARCGGLGPGLRARSIAARLLYGVQMAEVAQPALVASAGPALEHAGPAGLAGAVDEVQRGAEGERGPLRASAREAQRVRQAETPRVADDRGPLDGASLALELEEAEVVQLQRHDGEVGGADDDLSRLIWLRRGGALRLRIRVHRGRALLCDLARLIGVNPCAWATEACQQFLVHVRTGRSRAGRAKFPLGDCLCPEL
mmetsp:Transcript_18449/g.57843  ORF Transcript_18449/g.57843 Transcript_18449/m.57843 type:complete len:206 (+) Transcript_18449:286-903(+)